MDYDPALVQQISELSKSMDELEIQIDQLEGFLGLDGFHFDDQVRSEFTKEEIEVAESFLLNRINLQNFRCELNAYLKHYNTNL